ncbi:PAS domain-containing protein, partial [Staphylococcus pseudintermedius]
YIIEVTNKRGDGTRFPVEVHSAGFVHDGARRIIAVARDLSSREESELRFRELVESIDRGLIVQDDALRIVYANSAAMRAAGRELSGDWQPDGGRIVRGGDGRATGVFIDDAMFLVERARPPLQAAAVEQALSLGMQAAARHGLTGVH